MFEALAAPLRVQSAVSRTSRPSYTTLPRQASRHAALGPQLFRRGLWKGRGSGLPECMALLSSKRSLGRCSAAYTKGANLCASHHGSLGKGSSTTLATLSRLVYCGVNLHPIRGSNDPPHTVDGGNQDESTRVFDTSGDHIDWLGVASSAGYIRFGGAKAWAKGIHLHGDKPRNHYRWRGTHTRHGWGWPFHPV